MRRVTYWGLGSVLILFAFSAVVPGSEVAWAQTEDLFLARVATENHATMHYAQASESHGRWIAPDVYYIDFGSNLYREVGAGGGATLFHSSRFAAQAEAYIDQALGPASRSALYLVPYVQLNYRFSSRVAAETVYFPYFPLNQAGRIQNVLERAKVEYLFSRLKIGAGYGGYQAGDQNWQNKPFLTATLRGRALGDLEFWLQRLPGNRFQAQVRYHLLYKHPPKQ